MAPKSDTGKSARTGRDDRLKAALKANLARRKAQAKARAGSAEKTGAPSSDKDA
ncbi:hypothetical protein KUH32_11380 [Thalassococcus sp. CAU 1522]|uniref:DUF4169 domain-containing protein n=1 Tax=Thalassococcus arenae TaxID=2851652 RepID=A0ABS6N8N9_9RHOB|nr:hypothetical protein [Thalassococcus arenae]MBV2360380.1 hypothetical protein [Thalassococcus arenae]